MVSRGINLVAIGQVLLLVTELSVKSPNLACIIKNKTTNANAYTGIINSEHFPCTQNRHCTIDIVVSSRLEIILKHIYSVIVRAKISIN